MYHFFALESRKKCQRTITSQYADVILIPKFDLNDDFHTVTGHELVRHQTVPLPGLALAIGLSQD